MPLLNRFFAISLQIFWQKFWRNVFLSGPPPSISFYTKPLNFIGCHGNQNVKFAKTYLKNQLLGSYKGDKAETWRIVYNISLYKNIAFYCRCFSTLVAMATLNFHRPINGKNENWHLLLFHCRYFDERFLEMFVEWSSTKHTHFVQTFQFDWLSWQPKGSIAKNFKINSLQKCFFIFFSCCKCTLVAIAT